MSVCSRYTAGMRWTTALLCLNHVGRLPCPSDGCAHRELDGLRELLTARCPAGPLPDGQSAPALGLPPILSYLQLTGTALPPLTSLPPLSFSPAPIYSSFKFLILHHFLPKSILFDTPLAKLVDIANTPQCLHPPPNSFVILHLHHLPLCGKVVKRKHFLPPH